ncbi:MAG: arsenite efflux transporter metallochaperone ArsD, partial [Cyclobacteriaceae bacterium]
MKITLLDPAMCCSTGVCGPEVDDVLVQTAANIKWLKSMGHEVNRHNLSNDGEAFKLYPEAIAKLQQEGRDSLPYVLVNGAMVMSGKYPSKAEWIQFLDQGTPEKASKDAPIQDKSDQKTVTLIGIGAAIAASNESALEAYAATAKNMGIAAQEIAEAMNIGNEVKNTI